MPKKTFSIFSLGCFRNRYDSELVAKRFLVRGFSLNARFLSGKKPGRCHTLLINTCGFIDHAKEESLEAIEEGVDLKKKGKIKKLLVFGCFVERFRKDLEKNFPAVDQWQGVEAFPREFVPRKKLSLPHLDFLKISEGCRNKCSYCAIPLIKGGLKSKPLEEIVKEAKFLDKRGVKELTIIGQDITSWGKDLKNKESLTVLLKSILKATKKIRWLRLIYTHPRYFTDELIDLIATEERVCRYIDLPIQHINDRILKLMNRKTTKQKIFNLIKRIRKKIPDSVIRTSLIVGFPTEGREEFKELLEFIKEVKFERLGAFSYSREEGTPAFNLPGQLHYAAKKRRLEELMGLQREIVKEANQRFLGRDLDVLIDEKENGIFVGRSEYDAHEVDGVVYINKKGLTIGNFCKTKIVDAYEYDLLGV